MLQWALINRNILMQLENYDLERDQGAAQIILNHPNLQIVGL